MLVGGPRESYRGDWGAGLMEWSAGRVPSGPSPFLEGLCVRLTGLQQQGHMNDRSGTLVKFHTERGRWQVNVDGESLLLKASNLCRTGGGPAAGADAEVLEEAVSECSSVESGPK